ncbi:hypothetical protein J1N35_040937 [Gossypium stocksii]|uniref:Uncharacterized protein n=1 Tax=Gossypium stocksii TaxID=47602 RepID=A0A9D3ZJ93_9ROSI|nr:hypothetical protein J1N35_040937 [Gossypium stocksii]
MLPIAFPTVDKENMKSWEFFLTNLWMYVVRDDNICIISDRGKGGIIAAIRHFDVPWASNYYMQDIAANFHRKYKNTDWQKQATFYRLATLMPRMGLKQVN